MYYTGIGSRRTPAPVLATMTTIARYLAERGWTLRSGGATGADSAFEAGADGRAEIFIPWNGFNGRWNSRSDVAYIDPRYDTGIAAQAIAARIHPAWAHCDEATRLLHTRNIFQVSGPNLDNLSAFVVYWAPEVNGESQGGTRTAVMYARELGVPTFNLLHGTDALKQFLLGESHTHAAPDEATPAPRRAASTDVAG